MYGEEDRLDLERVYNFYKEAGHRRELEGRALDKEIDEREKRENRISLGEIIGCGVDILMSPIFYFIEKIWPPHPFS